MQIGTQDIISTLTKIDRTLDGNDHSKFVQECELLRRHVGNCSLSAMIVYRLRKITKLTLPLLLDSKLIIKDEINSLTETLRDLKTWECVKCGQVIETENKEQLDLWINAHIISEHG